MSNRRRGQNPYNYTPSEPEIRGQIGIEDLVRLHINRINIASAYEQRTFARFLSALKANLPERKQREIDGKTDEYLWIDEYWEYKRNCGVPIGTPEHPIMGSPKLVQVIKVDWDRFYELLMNACEESGITWKIEKETIELGRVKKVVPKPTPYFGDEETSEETGDIEEISDEEQDD